jgi:hypothetical protein
VTPLAIALLGVSVLVVVTALEAAWLWHRSRARWDRGRELWALQ